MRDVFCLGFWHINALAGTVTSEHGEVRQLRGKAMDVLLVLVEADGQVVTKNELIKAVWGSHCVTENSLNQAISEIRKVMGDDRRKPRYIKTVHRRGYRLCASLDSPTTLGSPRIIRRHIRSLAAGAAIIALIAFGLVANRDNSAAQLATVASPNGQRIAYFQKSDGVSTLYVIDKNYVRPRPVADIVSPDRHALSWSADGSFLVYNATANDKPYYAINIVRPNGDDALFIKFAKDQTRHANDSVPPDLNTEIVTVDHEEWNGDGYRIHRIDILGETLSVMFTGKRITGFAWSEQPFS